MTNVEAFIAGLPDVGRLVMVDVGTFIAGIPGALTPEALGRAVQADRMRDQPDNASISPREVWADARGRAKAAVVSVVDLKTPGEAREAAWAAVAVAMDAAGAVALKNQLKLEPEIFARLYAPWAFMVGEVR